MHVVLYKKGTDKISYVIKNCIRKGRNFLGDNRKISVNLDFYDVMWTNDDVNIISQDAHSVEWDKNVSDLTPSTDIAEIKPPTRQNYIAAHKIKKLIDNLTYQELETYIENNVVDLPSAKEFLKTLSKVTLALCKIVDSK